MAARQLAEPLAAVNCLVNPAAVLLGGRLPTPMMETLADRINGHMRNIGRDLPVVAPVARATLSEDAPAVGAAILPFSHYLLPRAGALWKSPAPGTA